MVNRFTLAIRDDGTVGIADRLLKLVAQFGELQAALDGLKTLDARLIGHALPFYWEPVTDRWNVAAC